MEQLTQLPDETPVIGIKQIRKRLKAGEITKIVAAKNCPPSLLTDISVPIHQFVGDQKELGTKLGKPFPIALVGYTE